MKYFALTCTIFMFVGTLLGDKLRLSIEFCRHGARGPVSYPFHEQVLGPFPQGPGNLTPTGMRMHGLLGEQLRQRFVNETGILPADYNINEMMVFADNANRTIQSAESQMYGLYPLGTGLKMENILEIDRSVPPRRSGASKAPKGKPGSYALAEGLAPIPVSFWNITNQMHNCPAMKEIKEESKHNSTLIELEEEMAKPYLPKVAAWTGISEERYASDIKEVFKAAGLIECAYWQGIKIPNFDPTEDFDLMMQLVTDHLYFGDVHIPEGAILRASPMLDSVKELLEKSIAGESELKFVLFSGHDTDLAALLVAMNQERLTVPFASTLFLDLYELDQENTDMSESSASKFYVKARFNEQELEFPSCSSDPCSVNDFIEFLTNSVNPNWKELCNA